MSARLYRLICAHFLTVISEWAATIGVLVYAYKRGGSSAVGFVSVAVLAPPLVFAPIAANLTAKRRAHSVRLFGFAVQGAAFTAAAVAAALDASLAVVATAVVVGIGAINTLRPTGASLLPKIARSTRELVTANLRISYCESASAFVGPLAAALLAELGGSNLVFSACAAASALAFVSTVWRPAPLVLSAPSEGLAMPDRGLRVAIVELRKRKWAVGVLGVASARHIVVGAFDVLMVIVASKSLSMGQSGSGRLWTLYGAGALLSTVVITVVLRRSKLSMTLAVTVTMAAAICLVIGLSTSQGLVFAVLPLLGICASLIDNISRILLQRSTDPRYLGPLFALVGLVAGLGQVLGSLIAQILLWIGDLKVALIGVGVVLVVIAVSTLRSLRLADSHADVPVVEMALLGNLPMFAPLQAGALEMVARSAEQVTVLNGEEIIRQGDQGDTFYTVIEGEFEIIMNGEFIRSAPRGDFFGEVALLSATTRTATVRAKGPCEVLAIHRDPFLTAVTGQQAAHTAALDYVAGMNIEEKDRRTKAAAEQRGSLGPVDS